MIRLIVMIVLMFSFVMPQAWASTSQYPDPNRQTMWNNITDGIHTIGQTPLQARQTKRKLHNIRTRARERSISQANRAQFMAKRAAWLKSQQQQQ